MEQKLKYPKLTLLFVTYCVALILSELVTKPEVFRIHTAIIYPLSLVSGFFYAFGFTAALATVVLIALSKMESSFWTVLVAGFGALLGDILIYRFIKITLWDELHCLCREPVLRPIWQFIKGIHSAILIALASIIIATPLPTELGVAMLTVNYKINMRLFILLAFVLHTVGIYSIMSFGLLSAPR